MDLFRSEAKTKGSHHIESEEFQIRKLMNEFREAAIKKDIEKVMSFYAPDVVAFDIIPPLQYIGKDEYRKSWEEAFAACKDDPNNLNDIHGLNIVANEDIAFCHAINHNIMVSHDGTKIEMWMRSTHCFEKMNGKWLITHEQFSVPADFETGKALFDLKPDLGLH